MITLIASVLILGVISASIVFWPRRGYVIVRMCLGLLAFIVSLFAAYYISHIGRSVLEPIGSLVVWIFGSEGFAFVDNWVSRFQRHLRLDGWGYLNEIGWLLSFALGIGTLAIYALLRGLVFVLGWCGRLFGLASRTVEGRASAPISGQSGAWLAIFRNRGMAKFSRYFALAFYLIVAFGPFAIAWIHQIDVNGATIGAHLAGIESVVWFGIYALSLELAGAFDPVDLPRDSEEESPHHGSPSAQERDVRDLYDHIQRTYPDCILLAREPRRTARESDEGQRMSVLSESQDEEDVRTSQVLHRLEKYHHVPPEVIDQLRVSLNRFLVGDGMLIFKETLTQSHYALLIELCLVTLDSGGFCLIVCPDAVREDVEKTLEGMLKAVHLDAVVRMCSLGTDEPNRLELFNVIVAPESFLEDEFLEEPEAFAAEHRRLRLLICLELQDLDLSQLKLLLTRLRQQTVRQLYVVSQVTDRDEPIVATVFDTEREIGHNPPITLFPETTVSRYLLVWQHGQQTVKSVQRKLLPAYNRPVETLPQAVLASVEQDYPVFLFDPMRRRYSNGWSRLVSEGIGAHEDLQRRGIGARLLAVPSGPHIGGRNAAPVIYVEDCGNLAAAVLRNYNYRPGQQILLNVICHDYPLRDFFLDQMKKDTALINLGEFLPMSPQLSFGVTELAYLVLKKLGQKSGLPQEELFSDFEQLASAELLNNLAIGPNLTGLETLLRKAMGQDTPAIYSEVDDDEHEQLFRISLAEARRRRLRFNLSVRLEGTPFAGAVMEDADRGTAFAEGTVFKAGDNFYQVESLINKEMHVRSYDPLTEGNQTRPTYVFDRKYTINLSPEDSVFEGMPMATRVGEQIMVLSHLQANFTRRTVGFYALEEGIPIFQGGHEPGYRPVDSRKHSAERRFKSVLHLYGAGLSGTMDEHARGKLAFTLCVLIHDVIVSVFPQQARRIAVLSSQSAMAFSGGPKPSALAEFVRHRYGELDQVNGDPYVRFKTIGGVKQLDGISYSPATDRLDLFIVEDSDRDLGVARRIGRGGSTRFFKLCRDYANWMCDGDAETRTFHRFGASEAPDIFDFQNAARFLGFCANMAQSAGPDPDALIDSVESDRPKDNGT